MAPRTCVTPEGRFAVGLHAPEFEVENLRENTTIARLGALPDGRPMENRTNFPPSSVKEAKADRIYEIANAFPFRGTTFINSAWADRKAGRPEAVALPPKPACSLTNSLNQWLEKTGKSTEQPPPILDLLPRPMVLALAQASTDPGELAALAAKSCTLCFDDGPENPPTGVAFKEIAPGKHLPEIHDHDLYDILGNNPALPDAYKEVMVLRPGIQGNSEIVGEASAGTHVFEYLRRNSYIPWGHFASNMANDRIRYRTRDLTLEDMAGIRHLYYQRVYVRTARQLGMDLPVSGRPLTQGELETLRLGICAVLAEGKGRGIFFDAALWGWNFGFGFAQSGHRLHASHQMIHQQNAMVPRTVTDTMGNPYDCFSCGDLVTDFIREFKAAHGREFFPAYLEAVRTNERTDGRKDKPSSLIVYEDDKVILFAPKAQVSEWELALMPKTPCAHVLALDTDTRRSVDVAMLTAVQALESLGADMITSVEFSGRFSGPGHGQHLVYSFIPRLPYAPGTFSEAQLRWITGCYPEDVAAACRQAIAAGPA
ncbi:MAG: hypothetical protein HUN04_21065 [Desulfobacter sp.]|nr:MAG: hypothetical protein HUN04_21065 [Desulfobacter sp.]